ncbi:hypothetical protein GDO81_023877 [Engystomops pustulosus]|uniref:Uncharacterized protein n=1 Tax=Engystomops pustulosus TaxID=76066 RepID=A0AAV6ZRB0_ENGPU|nr:hypothetical protein GDO81_023877 [Engystomops pustulosus]KAG8550944.1 hypothetical protein GDO81_023877 [Engystomops pustulosus]KAG8550945.1 hypothetical protein GDO81_023877 [Engystomops pustulosus]KAG8550946.1 hypothetical protein GDO81_023877 [Engystomops pustulosus]KAG8550947.1 hypothetical protein GDO81_023877 [Engystomops pustulosus]
MASASGLFQCSDPKTWKRVSDMYWEVVAAKGAKQKKLLELDRWYQEELPALIGARPHKSLTSEEMVKLMEWKLTRGKFRPRLKQLVSSNAASTVESCTRKAFQLLPDVSAAIEELCQLKGIGPATASAVLSAGAPELSAFMADEAVESVPGLFPIQYNVKHYLRYLEELNKKSEALSKASEEAWTPHRVELCLWTWKVAEKHCPELLESLGDEKERPAKKLKTKQ